MFCGLTGSAFSQEPEQFDFLLAAARRAEARGNFEAAAEFYRKAVAIHPEIAELRANLGLMYYQTGKDQQAIDAFSQAIRLKPSLLVPNLFLGLDYVKLKRFNDAIPHLKRAVLLNVTDIQAQLGLGQAYAGIGKTRLATDSYLRVVRLDPKSADGWFHLGVSYLEQVESDSRILLARHKDSAFLDGLVADNLAEQREFVQAADAYKEALTLPTFPAGTHAAYGFVLLNQHDVAGAERELNAELASNPGSLAAKLGLARLHIESGAATESAKEIEGIWKTDAGFLRANVPLFNSGLAESKRSELQRNLEERDPDGDISQELVSLFRIGATGEKPVAMPQNSSIGAEGSVGSTQVPASAAAESYTSGRYGECNDLLAPRLQLLPANDLRLLASCAYSTGNFRNALDASQKLARNAPTEAEGLYWEDTIDAEACYQRPGACQRNRFRFAPIACPVGRRLSPTKGLPGCGTRVSQSPGSPARRSGCVIRLVFDAACRFRHRRGVSPCTSRVEKESR
jgi:tetratricopeptide (TPR) repeat protein